MISKLQDLKEKIDGFHSQVADGIISAGDCSDSVGALIGREDGQNADIYHELHDYVVESMKKFGLL